jgi:glycosyltransferase involved in cell wall biosynthesis
MTAPAKRTRVLYCESNVDGTIGGSHYCLLYLVEGLDKTRFEPIVVFHQDNPLVPRFRESAETLVLERPAPYVPGVMRTPFARRYKLLLLPVTLFQRAVNFFGFAGLVRRYMTFLRTREIEIVHLNNSIIRHHDWMLAALLTRTPALTHERGINRWYSPASKFFSKRLRAVISMSKSISDFLTKGGVDTANVRVLYDGVNPGALKLTREPAEIRQMVGAGPGDKIIGIVGNVRRWKGQEVVVRALPAIVQQHPSTICLIVGAPADSAADRAYVAHLEKLIRELGVERNVRFLGYQKFPHDFVRVMDVVIHASIEPEPFGMVVLEAMAMKKPMVGSRAGGVPEMVIEGVTGYTYPPGDSAELAARVNELLSDPAAARRLGEAAHQRVVEHFSVDQYVRDVEDVYRAVLAGDPLPAGVV